MLRFHHVLLAVGLAFVSVPANAEGICAARDSAEEAHVQVTGTVVSVAEFGAIVEIADDCGSIEVMLPGDTEEDQEAIALSCQVGAKADVAGIIFLGGIEATDIVCE